MADDDEAEAVQVAVRVRPFNSTDGEKPSLIVTMNGKTTTIKNPETGATKDFTYDYCFNSHYTGNRPDWGADQSTIWNTLGTKVLANAFAGFNSTLFAYGQSGSGKSFSMTANPKDDDGKGIVPRAARAIFMKRDENADPLVEQRIEAHMVEIYNEKIRCLLHPEKNPDSGLDLKENPDLGPTLYIGNQIYPSTTMDNIETMIAMLNAGELNMTKAATNLNKSSSRAHTVFTLIYTYKRFDPQDRAKVVDIKRAQINLVDLAGSERVAKTGTQAGSKEFKEGININKSLTALGQVIETLGKNAMRRAKGQKEEFVKYRDSMLTLMLKESLGGNSKTVMIAALRPNDANYDETISTLRYASSAKLIQNKSKVNTTDPNVLAKMYQQKYEELKKQMAAAMAGGAAIPGADVQSAVEKEKEAARIEMERQMEEAERRMSEMKRAFEEQLKQSEATKLQVSQFQGDNKKRDEVAHLLNLHEDERMSMMLFFFFETKVTRICRPESVPPPSDKDIALSGILIENDHCTVSANDDKSYTLLPTTQTARTFVNGALIQGPIILNHFDRVQLGASMLFIFVNPATRGNRLDPVVEGINWRFGQRELNEQAMKSLAPVRIIDVEEEKRMKLEADARMQEIEKRLSDQQDQASKLQAEKEIEFKKKMEEMTKRQEEQLEAARTAASENVSKQQQNERAIELAAKEAQFKEEAEKARLEFMHKQAEFENLQRNLQVQLEESKHENERLIQRKEAQNREQMVLEENIMRVLPAIQEANFVSEQMKCGVFMSIKIVTDKALTTASIDRTTVSVFAKEEATGSEGIWGLEEFLERVCMMRESYHEFINTKKPPKYEDEQENPYYIDSTKPTVVGEARVYLEPLLYLFDITDHIGLLDNKGLKSGFLTLHMVPFPLSTETDARKQRKMAIDSGEDENGVVVFNESHLSELIGKGLVIDLYIKKVMGLSAKNCCSVHCKYKFWDDTKATVTEIKDGINVELQHCRRIQIDVVTPEFVKYITEDVVKIEVLAAQTKASTVEVLEEESEEPLNVIEKLLGFESNDIGFEEGDVKKRMSMVIEKIQTLQDQIGDMGSPANNGPSELRKKDNELFKLKTEYEKVQKEHEMLKKTVNGGLSQNDTLKKISDMEVTISKLKGEKEVLSKFENADSLTLKLELQKKDEENAKLKEELANEKASKACTIL